MLVLKLELHDAVSGKISTIASAIIFNNGTGDAERGNYNVHVARKNRFSLEDIARSPLRKGRVDNYPRLSYNVWRLVIRALKSAFPEEK